MKFVKARSEAKQQLRALRLTAGEGLAIVALRDKTPLRRWRLALQCPNRKLCREQLLK